MSKSAEQIRNNIIGNMTVNTQEGSFVSDVVTPISLEMENLYIENDKTQSMLFIAGLTGDLLDSKASEYGIVRKVATIDNEEIKESDVELQVRVIDYISNPSSSGNEADYKRWSKEIFDISDAHVMPLWNGEGTVKVLPVTTNKKAPSIDKITEVSNYMQTKRPVGANVTVIAPTEVAINISATVVLKNSDINTTKNKYTILATEYLKYSVFKLSNVDYNKVVSMFYDLEDILSVTNVKVNNATSNIVIAETEIQVIGTITLVEAS